MAIIIFLLFNLQFIARSKSDTTFLNIHYDSIQFKGSSDSIFGFFNYKNDKLDGQAVEFRSVQFFDTTINIIIFGQYHQGMKTGLWRSIDSEGFVMSRGFYRKNKPNGDWCMFYGLSIYRYNRNGKLKQKISARGLSCPSD
ncbi:MAG: hypothetical protein H6600_08970 [Flavobacteriales bacterium]|nr:hypothetical protein [Flavobacteriales bacterium]MCB9198579.1 hypothetical protein [Flavobacteriales bacterium]